jgi:hypothetical protein
MHMPLLNEAADVWRPVEVTPLVGGVYRVEGIMPADEEWAFPPGTVVDVKWRTFSDGEKRLIPTQASYQPLSHTLGHLLIAGLVVSIAAWGIQFLPSAYQPSRPLYALAWLGASIAAYAALRTRRPYLGSIARALAFIFGAVFLISLLMRN